MIYCNDRSCLPDPETAVTRKISHEVDTENTASSNAANFAKIHDKNFELIKENLTMKNQIDLQEKTIRSLRSDVSQYEAEISRLQISSLIISTPQNERLELSPRTPEIDRHDHEKLAFESQYKSKVITSMETEIAIITESLKKTQMDSGLLLQSNADKDNLSSMIENHEKTIQELTEHNSSLQHESIRNYSKVSELTSLIEINNSTVAPCQEYQISTEDEENMRALDRQVRSWTDKFSKLDEEYFRIKSQKTDQDEWVRKLRKDVECKDFELQSERDKNADSKAYIDSLKLDIERLTLRVDEKIMRIQVIEYDFIDIENSNKLLTSEKDYLEIQHKKNLTVICGLREACDGDRGRWEEVEGESERKDKKIKDLEGKSEDWVKKYNKKCAKLTEAESTISGKVKKIESLQPEILRGKEVIRTLNYEVTDWKNKFDRKETELDNERRDTERLESKLSSFKDELRAMESQVSKLMDEVGQARKDKREAENERMAAEDQ